MTLLQDFKCCNCQKEFRNRVKCFYAGKVVCIDCFYALKRERKKNGKIQSET